MKKIAILFSILVVALFAVPGLIGFMAQNHYQEIVIGMQQAGLEVTRSDYQRGWFGSRSETEFKLILPQDLEVDGFTLSMHSDIVHGPLSPDGGLALATVGTYFKINGNPLFQEDEGRVMRSRIGLDGKGRTMITIPALKLSGEPGRPEIKFSGAEGELLFDAGFSQLNIDLKIPELWVGGGDGQSLKVVGVTLGSKSKVGPSGLRLGDGALGIKQIEFVSSVSEVSIKVDSIDLFGGTREDGGNLAFSAHYTLKAIEVNEINYGPAELKLDIGNIPAAVAVKLQHGVRDIRSRKLPREQQGMVMLSMLMEAGPDLLKANPKLDIKRLYVKTPDGEIDGRLSLAVDGLLWSEVGDIGTILGKLEADATLRLPEKLLHSMLERQANQSVRQHIEMRKKMDDETVMPTDKEIQALGQDLVEGRLNVLLQQGMLVRDGVYIFSSAKLGDGLLSVNGKTIPLNSIR